MQLLITCLLSCISTPNIHIVVGDFNLSNIDWNLLSGHNDVVDNLFLDFVIQNSLSQLVNFPTRYHNVLDLVFTDVERSVVHVIPHEPIGLSDHAGIEVLLSLACGPAVLVADHHTYLWQAADYDKMAEYLYDIDWFNVVCHNPDITQLWKIFDDILAEAVNTFVPISVRRCSYKSPAVKKPCPRAVRNCVLKKRKIWKALNSTPWDSALRQKYRDCVHKLRLKLKQHHDSVEDKLISCNNLGAFYRYVNKRISNGTAIGAIVDNGVVLTDNSLKANLFNRHFASVGTVDNGAVPDCADMASVSVLDHITISESAVLASIAKLKSNYSSGPDGFPPILYKCLKHCLVNPLTLLYNQLLSVAYVPPAWLSAHIVPVHKKGVTGDVDNYRPISLTCVASKILERIIVDHLTDHFSRNNILHQAQHGFTRRRSTCTNLLESCNDWTLCVQNKQQVTVVYIDFTKAFDIVSHRKLFARLYSYGVRGTLLTWLQKFFTGRTLQTKVGSCLSDVADLLSGVVQGSGVGPCMFLVYINELVIELAKYNITVKVFADDVKLYVTITNDLDANQLQLAVDLLCRWASDWQLKISVNKCCVLNLGKHACDVSVCINNCTVPVTETVRDLGITISRDLSPSVHINDIVSRAHKRAFAILRAFQSRNVNLLIRAFITYVRPIVEYNSIIWSPATVCNIEAIESVQRRFTKRLPGLSNLPYRERLKSLDIPSLELRRLQTDLFWCYKIIFGMVDVKCDEFFALSTFTSTRGHSYKLYKHRSLTGVRANFFTERVVNIWNNLPANVDFGSFAKFRRSVIHTDFSRYLRF